MKKRTKKILVFGILILFAAYVVCRIIELIPSWWDLVLFIMCILAGGLHLRDHPKKQK